MILAIKLIISLITPFTTISLTGATALRAAAVFGPGTGRVWVNVPQCSLDSTSLDNCTFATPLGVNHSCAHNSDAGVICFSEFGMAMIIEGINPCQIIIFTGRELH